MRIRCLTGLLLILAPWASSQNLELHVKDGPPSVRPFESLTIQARAYRTELDEDGNERRVQVRPGQVKFQLQESGGGWLSKPFHDSDATLPQDRSAGIGDLLGNIGLNFVIQESILFTASDVTGPVRIRATSQGVSASLTLQVAGSAPSRRSQTRTATLPRPSLSQPYRDLAEHYAPFIAQATWFQPRSDYISRFDFDADWKGDNNWDNTDGWNAPAYVYYTVVESETHWFLIYSFFHSRDYSDNCVAGTCHENDNEGIILTVAKEGGPTGRVQAMESLAHNNIYSYRADRRVRGNAHGLDGAIEFQDGSHPVVFIESGGHGVYASSDRRSRYDVRHDRFRGTTGVTYRYTGKAEEPLHGNDRLVGYQLLPILDHWWKRAWDDRRDEAFADDFQYTPYGNRPGVRQETLPGAFLGRRHGANKARPFWGWSDKRTSKKKLLAQGQWGLDPAYAVSRNLKFPSPFSLRYLHNPYLDLSERSVAPPSDRTAPPAPRPTRRPIRRLPDAESETRTVLVSTYNRPRDYDTRSSGKLEMRFRASGSNLFSIDGDTLRRQGRLDASFELDRFRFSQPMPRTAYKKFEVSRKSGKGSVAIVQRPEARNRFVAIFRLVGDASERDYRILVKWKRE